jgi:hypothetical protein
MNYDCPFYKPFLASDRSFDEDGRPYRIADDDLEDIFSESDFAQTGRHPA